MTKRRLIAVGALALAAFAVLVALGTWQLERRLWKLDLIAKVERRIDAAPVAAPGPAEWPGIGPDDAYLRVVADGTWLPDRDTLVQAATVRGSGWWVMTPLSTPDGIILINRGFVAHRGAPRPLSAGSVSVAGLLRVSERGGGFLRDNDPAADRWYSRDVAAIAAARRIGPVAPYFIDADAAPGGGAGPVGGLTVVRFRNNHLVYALTWYALALMVAGGYAIVVRAAWRDGCDRRRKGA